MGTGPGDYSRVNRPHSSATRYYNILAPWYDLLACSEKQFIRGGLELLNPQPGEQILEIGIGTGYAAQRIIPHLGDGFYAGLDLSPGMAYQSQRRLRRGGLLKKGGLVCSDSLPLPFPANTFKKVFTSFTLELFDTPQIPILLSECRRVLRSDGALVIISLSKDQPLGLMGRLYEQFHDRYPTLADCRPIPVRLLLEENGFFVEDLKLDKMWGIPIALAAARID